MSTTTPNLADGNVQWLRYARLKLAKVVSVVLVDPKDTMTLDLSEMHFRFQINGSFMQTPNIAVVRIYNPSEETAKTIVDEYDQLSIEAGYESNHSVIFIGTIRQYKRGRENTTDTFIELMASTCDVNYNFGFMNVTLGGAENPATWRDVYSSICQHMGVSEDFVTQELIDTRGRAFMARGRAFFGLTRVHANELALAFQSNWSIQTVNGVNVLVLTQTAGLRPGQAIILGPETGLVGVPEATVDGVQARCLLNPLLQVGALVQINQDLITQTDVPLARRTPSTRDLTPITAATTKIGLYQVMAADHIGDTRGQEWYTDIIGLAANSQASKQPLAGAEGGP